MLLRKKEEIKAWLKKNNIENYELIPNEEYGYIVNVNRDVSLFNCKLKNIEVKFNKIKGNFSCFRNQLESLEGCPEIISGFFDCSENKLKTLEGCPEIVKGDFYCRNNNLTMEGLKYLPKEVNSDYMNISDNEKLGSLQNITNFQNMKNKVEEMLNIKKEKEKLLNNINKKELNKNKIIHKI